MLDTVRATTSELEPQNFQNKNITRPKQQVLSQEVYTKTYIVESPWGYSAPYTNEETSIGQNNRSRFLSGGAFRTDVTIDSGTPLTGRVGESPYHNGRG